MTFHDQTHFLWAFQVVEILQTQFQNFTGGVGTLVMNAESS